MSRFLRKPWNQLAPYVPGEQPRLPRLIKLNTNESPFPPAPGVREVLSRAESERLRLYPDPEAVELRKAAAEFYGIPESRITVGNGSDELLAFLFMGYGERIFYPAISYGFYAVYGGAFAGEAGEVPLTEDLRIRPEDYCHLPGTVVLANPNAPTGIALSSDDIQTILRADPDRLVVIDEAYVDFGADSMVPFIDAYDNLLVIQTLSKSRSLAGARVGIALGQEPLIEDLDRIRFSFNPYNLSRLSILSAAAAFRDREYFDRCCRSIEENREYFTGRLKEQGFRVLPSKANFVFASPPRGDGKAYAAALRQRNILVRHFADPRLTAYVRITIGYREDLEAILRANEEMGETVGETVGSGE